MQIDVPAVAAKAARAELAWRGADGGLHATALVPLVIEGAVSAALPFSEAALARRLAAAAEAVLACTDPRMALRGWQPLVVPVRVAVEADRSGAWTWSGALDQEVRKYPPSQLLIDTAIQRREHWWYVPRWVVRLEQAGPAVPVARRSAPDDGLLVADDATARPGRLGAWPVAVDGWGDDPVALTPLDAGHPLPQPSGGQVLLFTHDFALPDQDRSTELAVTGTLAGRHLHVASRVGERMLPPPRLVARLRAHVRLGRACRQELAAYDSASADAT